VTARGRFAGVTHNQGPSLFQPPLFQPPPCPKLRGLNIWGQSPHSLSHCSTLHTYAVWALNINCIPLEHVQALGKINSRRRGRVIIASIFTKTEASELDRPCFAHSRCLPCPLAYPNASKRRHCIQHISILHPAWNFIRRPLCDCLPDGGERYFERTTSSLGPWHSETRIRVSEEAV
jgi:hypothetical protein